ncbi:MAG: 30S ribosomal protein S20 [bacterium]
MPLRSKSAKKRVRQAVKRTARNREAKRQIKLAIKAVERAVLNKGADVQDLLKNLFSVVDKAVERGIVHRNKAARQKSRLSKKVNKK